MIASKNRRDALLELIPKGKENAIESGKLAGVLHVSIRGLSQALLQARLDGSIIASCNQGYYIPETDNELLEYYRAQHKHATTQLRSLKPVRQELKRRGVKL